MIKNRLNNIKKEAKYFFQNRKLLITILLLSIFFIIKKTNISTPIWMPNCITNLLLCPNKNTNEYELLTIVYDLSMATISGIIVYIFVEYVPERKNNIKAFDIAKKQLVQIYSSMSRIISMYLYYLKINISEKDIKQIDLKTMTDLLIINKMENAKIKNYINGKKANSIWYSYNLSKDSNENVKKIKENIAKIKANASSGLLSSNLLYVLSEIENSSLLTMICLDMYEERELPGIRHKIIKIDEYFYNFIQYHIYLEQYDFNKITYTFEDVTKEELDKHKEHNVFCSHRGLISHMSLSDLKNRINIICSYPINKERFNKGNNFLLEHIFCYDIGLIKDKSFLDYLYRLAMYLENNNNNYSDQSYVTINKYQVIKRKRRFYSREIKELKRIARNSEDKLAKLCSNILLRKYDEALLIFGELDDNEKDNLIEWPIYRLWENPPVPPNPEPRVFYE